MNQISIIFTILLLQAVSFSSIAKSEGKPIVNNIGLEYQLKSNQLNEERKYLVRLPPNYADSEKKYPVVYLLDGRSHFTLAASALKVLEDNEKIPEVILIGISNNPGTRFRDLSQKPTEFLAFIEDELMPLINRNYRTHPHATLFGHSLAGFFTLHAMTTKNSQFANYIAASPHLLANENQLEQQLTSLLKVQQPLPYNLYFSMADNIGDGVDRVKGITELAELLKEKAPKSLNWHYQSMPGQDHMTTPFLTIFKGLTFAFQDYQMPRFLSYDAFIQYGGVEAIKSFYQQRAKKYAVSAEISEFFFGLLAEVMIGENKVQQALKLLHTHAQENPKSMRAHFDLARLYQHNGDKNLAIKSYKKAQSLLTQKQSGFSNYMSSQIKELEK